MMFGRENRDITGFSFECGLASVVFTKALWWADPKMINDDMSFHFDGGLRAMVERETC